MRAVMRGGWQGIAYISMGVFSLLQRAKGILAILSDPEIAMNVALKLDLPLIRLG